MADLFSASELLNIAIREEVNGAAFYRALAAKTDSEALRGFAEDVAVMEDDHAEKFRKILDDVGEYKPVGQSYDGEYEEYLSYLVEGRIFPVGEDGEKMAAQQKSDVEAVETAARMEQNTLLLYQELMRFVPESQRSILDLIMDEERMHLTKFTQFKEEFLS